MTKFFLFLMFIVSSSFQADTSMILDHVTIKIHAYDYNGEMKSSAMPELKPGSVFMNYQRRFEYLLINVSEIHLPSNLEQKNEI